MLDAAAEREHNQMALDAKAQGAEIALIHPPLDEDEQKSAQVDDAVVDRKSTRLNSSHIQKSRMPSSA